jgi:hypothetical protein
LKALVGGSSGKPRPIHLYRDEAAYRAAEVAAQPFRCRVEVGHVLLEPKVTGSHFVHSGLPQMARDGLLRAAAEQFVEPLVPPSMIRDWVQHVVVVGAVEAFVNPDYEHGHDAAYDRRRARFDDEHSRGEVLQFDRIVGYSVLVTNRFAWEWLMATSALTAQTLAADNKKGWAKKLLGKHALPPGKSGEIALRHVALESGDKHLAKARRRFAEVWASRPTWRSIQGVWHPAAKRSLLLGGPGYTAAVFTPATFLPTGDYTLSGTMEIGSGVDKYARIQLGWTQQDALMISFHEGTTRVSMWIKAENQWIRKVQGAANIAAGRPFRFRVDVTDTEVRVDIDGQRSCAWSHGGRDMHTGVTFEAENCPVWLSDVHAEPLPK